MSITTERIRDIAHYEAGTGTFRWLHDKKAGFKKSVLLHSAGDEMGCQRKDGRWVIRVDGKLYLRYRLAWLWVYGFWPTGEVDHINGDKTDDRFSNLRDVSKKTNRQNIRETRNGKSSSQLLGVYLDKRKKHKKWRSSINIGGRCVSLGYFFTETEAHQAYLDAKRKTHVGCTI